jgi:pimeloyl-ACP methyl ester carboxylesterase
MKMRLLILLAALPLATGRVTFALDGPLAFLPQKTFESRDSLNPGEETSTDAQQCLTGLVWIPASFQVTCEEADRGLGAALVRFPTPIPTGDSTNDNVSMEWYLARDKVGKPMKAPAVVVVHESGRSMPVGRLFARGLNQKQLHTFLIHLPHYGKRRSKTRPDGSNILTLMRQAIADVRRARDAVSVLPFVDSSHIALQGTSLGGFVSATTAGLDRGYDSVFLMLAGGDLFDLIQNGKRDTEKVRQRLEEAGMSNDDVRKMAHVIEPTRLAHRLDRNRTWLYSGKSDTVVPLKNANVLAEAVKLEKPHHILMNANHYSGIVYLPFVLRHISDQIASLSAADRKTQLDAD